MYVDEIEKTDWKTEIILFYPIYLENKVSSFHFISFEECGNIRMSFNALFQVIWSV